MYSDWNISVNGHGKTAIDLIGRYVEMCRFCYKTNAKHVIKFLSLNMINMIDKKV